MRARSTHGMTLVDLLVVVAVLALLVWVVELDGHRPVPPPPPAPAAAP